MQVNDNYSPNFGMALKIKSGAKEGLAKKSLGYLQGVRKAGEELQGHQHVDVELNEALQPIVKRRGCANAYFDYFKPVKVNGTGLEVDTRWAGRPGNQSYGDKYQAYLEFSSQKEAEEAYKKLNKANEKWDSLESAVEFAKQQEKSSAYKAQVAAQKAELQAKVNAEVDKLISDFPNVE